MRGGLTPYLGACPEFGRRVGQRRVTTPSGSSTGHWPNCEARRD